jgi:hypothetical protein
MRLAHTAWHWAEFETQQLPPHELEKLWLVAE